MPCTQLLVSVKTKSQTSQVDSDEQMAEEIATREYMREQFISDNVTYIVFSPVPIIMRMEEISWQMFEKIKTNC